MRGNSLLKGSRDQGIKESSEEVAQKPAAFASVSRPANCYLLPAISKIEAIPHTVLYNDPKSANTLQTIHLGPF
jgi:hypothetical protein